MPDYCCIGNFIARQISYNSQMSQKPTMQLWIYCGGVNVCHVEATRSNNYQ